MRNTLAIVAAVLALAASSAWSVGLRFKTPDSALAYYIESANAKNLDGINATFLTPVAVFNFTDSVPVERFRIVKRISYTEKDANDWNQKGITPLAVIGDVEFQVEETIAGKTFMFSYNFRETSSGWKIVTFVSWNDI